MWLAPAAWATVLGAALGRRERGAQVERRGEGMPFRSSLFSAAASSYPPPHSCCPSPDGLIERYMTQLRWDPAARGAGKAAAGRVLWPSPQPPSPHAWERECRPHAPGRCLPGNPRVQNHTQDARRHTGCTTGSRRAVEARRAGRARGKRRPNPPLALRSLASLPLSILRLTGERRASCSGPRGWTSAGRRKPWGVGA